MALSKLTDIRKSLSVEIEDLQVNGITTFTGSVSIGGTLTYEDVTNVDSIGIITARDGLKILAGGANVVGIVTATSFVGSLTGNVTGTASGNPTLTSGANNRVVTATGANTLTGETGLTYDTQVLRLNNTSANPQFHLTSADNGISELKFGDQSDLTRAVILYRSGTAGDALCFNGYNNTERLRIYSNGRILIGNGGVEQSPSGNLDIVGDTNSNGPELYLRVSNNNTTDNIGALLFGNNVDKSVCMVRGSTHTANNTGDIEFHTSTTGTMSEKLRITSSGILVTGAQTTPNSTDVGSIFLKGGADLGWLTSSGSITFNAYYNGGWKYVTSGTSHILWASSEGFNFSTASSGSANGTISYSRAMKIFTNNRVSIGDGNGGSPLGALHINTKSTMGTDTALWIGDNSANRYMAINQVSNSEQFSHMDLVFNDNGSRSMINLKNPYAPAGYGAAITWKGYNNGDQGYIECKSENANSAAATMYLNTTSGTFLQGNSSRHVTMPQQPSFHVYTVSGTQNTVLTFSNVHHNNGSHMNAGTGTFTCPVAGRYLFTFAFLHSVSPTSYARVLFQLNGSRSTQFGDTLCDDTGLYINTSMSMIFNLSTNDTVQLYNEGNNIYSQPNSQYGAFSGCLLF